MCQGSRIAAKTEDAVQGAVYEIGTTGVHDGTTSKVGALHALGSTVAECVYCVKTGQKLTLTSIPASLRKKFDLGKTAVATFYESKAFHTDDVLDFGGGKRTQFREFANVGVQVLVGVKHDTERTVKQLLDAAQSGPLPEGDEPAPAQRERIDA